MLTSTSLLIALTSHPAFAGLFSTAASEREILSICGSDPMKGQPESVTDKVALESKVDVEMIGASLGGSRDSSKSMYVPKIDPSDIVTKGKYYQLCRAHVNNTISNEVWDRFTTAYFEAGGAPPTSTAAPVATSGGASSPVGQPSAAPSLEGTWLMDETVTMSTCTTAPPVTDPWVLVVSRSGDGGLVATASGSTTFPKLGARLSEAGELVLTGLTGGGDWSLADVVELQRASPGAWPIHVYTFGQTSIRVRLDGDQLIGTGVVGLNEKRGRVTVTAGTVDSMNVACATALDVRGTRRP